MEKRERKNTNFLQLTTERLNDEKRKKISKIYIMDQNTIKEQIS
jgi:hypothetical protein